MPDHRGQGPRILVTGYEATVILELLNVAIDRRQTHDKRRLVMIKLRENIKVRLEGASVEAKLKTNRK